MTLPFLAFCALSGHLLAQRDHTRALHAALVQVHRRGDARLRTVRVASAYITRLRADLHAAQRSEQLARQELTTARANLTLAEQALAHPAPIKPAPTPGQGGFRSWGEVLGLDSLGTGERVREGMTFAELVATPLDPEAGA